MHFIDVRINCSEREIFMFQHLNKWCIWLYIKYDTLLTSGQISYKMVCCADIYISLDGLQFVFNDDESDETNSTRKSNWTYAWSALSPYG